MESRSLIRPSTNSHREKNNKKKKKEVDSYLEPNDMLCIDVGFMGRG